MDYGTSEEPIMTEVNQEVQARLENEKMAKQAAKAAREQKAAEKAGAAKTKQIQNEEIKKQKLAETKTAGGQVKAANVK